jgi:hypothetical protein
VDNFRLEYKPVLEGAFSMTTSSTLVRLLTVIPLVAAISILLDMSETRADEGADLLTLVKIGHNAARESISTFSADFQYEQTQPKQAVIAHGKYWRSLDVVRIREGEEGVATSDYLVKGGETRQVGRSWAGKQIRYTAGRRSSAETLGLSDVWMGMLITIVGPNGQPLSIDQLFDSAKAIPSATRETEDGNKCVRVELHFDRADGVETNLVLWHDIGHNYLIRKASWTYPTLKGERDVAEVLEFAEPTPGVYVPVKCRRRGLRGSTIVDEWILTLTEVQVNSTIPANQLRLPAIPSGTMLRDMVKGTRYPIDSSWNQIGPATPAPRIGVAPPAPDISGSEYTAPSTSEPTTLAYWIIVGSLTLLTGIVGYMLVRRLWIRAA